MDSSVASVPLLGCAVFIFRQLLKIDIPNFVLMAHFNLVYSVQLF